MFSIDYNGDTVFLLNDEWSGSDFEGDFSLVRDEQIALTKRSGRRAFSQTLLCKVRFQVMLKGESLRTAVGAWRDISTESVIVPFWPGVTRWSDRAAASIQGGLMIAFKRDWSHYEIYAAGDAEPVWPAADDSWAPALMGLLAPTEPRMLSPDAAVWDIDFSESSASTFCLLPAAFVFAAGPQPAGYAAAPSLLPIQPNFKQVVEQVRVDVARDQIGFSREQGQTFYPHSAWRSQKADYLLVEDAIAKLLHFFLAVAGPGDSFWVPGWLQLARLTADVDAADTVLDVDGTAAVRIGDYVALGKSDSFVCRKVTGKTANTITIDVAPGVDLAGRSSLLLPLCLARLTNPTLSLKWKRPGASRCELFWEEMPTEVLIPADETLGDTIGKLPLRAVLFQFTRDYKNGTVDKWYFTSFEQDVVWNGQVWTSGKFKCGAIPQSLNIEDDETEVTSFLEAGNPIIEDVALRAEAPLSVKIYFADLLPPGVERLQDAAGEDIQGPGGENINPANSLGDYPLTTSK